MDWGETLSILAVAVGVFVWAAARERRPVDLLQPRLIPYLGLMGIAAVTILLMLAHVITLATGQPFVGGTRW